MTLNTAWPGWGESSKERLATSSKSPLTIARVYVNILRLAKRVNDATINKIARISHTLLAERVATTFGGISEFMMVLGMYWSLFSLSDYIMGIILGIDLGGRGEVDRAKYEY